MKMKKISSIHWMGRFLALAILASVALAGATGWADALYIFSGSEMDVVLNESVQAIVPRLIDITTGTRGVDVTLAKGTMVTILRNGAALQATAQKETIAQFLTRLQMEPGPLEMVGIEVYEDGVTLNISDRLTAYEKVTETAPHITTYCATPELPYGTQRIVQAGADGMREAVYEQTWVGGQLAVRQLVEELSNTSVPAIVEEGTTVTSVEKDDHVTDVKYNADGSGYLVFASGVTMRFKEARTMTATAYSAAESTVNEITATGTKTHPGVVAVDKKVIPLGTELYVMAKGVEYGMAKAEDTGVRGNIIDLYYDTLQECREFGRRGATVYLLEQ